MILQGKLSTSTKSFDISYSTAISAWCLRVRGTNEKWKGLNCVLDDETLECCFLRDGWGRARFYNYCRTQHLNLLTAAFSVSVIGCNDWNFSAPEIVSPWQPTITVVPSTHSLDVKIDKTAVGMWRLEISTMFTIIKFLGTQVEKIILKASIWRSCVIGLPNLAGLQL